MWLWESYSEHLATIFAVQPSGILHQWKATRYCKVWMQLSQELTKGWDFADLKEKAHKIVNRIGWNSWCRYMQLQKQLHIINMYIKEALFGMLICLWRTSRQEERCFSKPRMEWRSDNGHQHFVPKVHSWLAWNGQQQVYYVKRQTSNEPKIYSCIIRHVLSCRVLVRIICIWPFECTEAR